MQNLFNQAKEWLNNKSNSKIDKRESMAYDERQSQINNTGQEIIEMELNLYLENNE